MSSNERLVKTVATLASVATILGVCVAVIALIPAFGQWLNPREPAQYVDPSGVDSSNPDSQIPTNSPGSYSSYSFPSIPNNPPVTFFNEWVNVDSQTDGLKRVSIQAEDGSAYINMFGACTQGECNFRDYSPTPTVNYDYDPETQILHVQWFFDFEIMKQELTITSDGQLKVISSEHFIDNSGRLDYESVEYFTRQ